MNIEEVIENLRVIKHPHPTLRHKSKPLVKVDRHIKAIVARMFELMYEHRGVGLAANQVDLPFQLFVINLESDPNKGEELVFINPVIELPKGNREAEEGCLSIPQVYGSVVRPEQIHVKAYSTDGSEIDSAVNGFLAQAVQHEYDHLQGVMFPDRMSEAARKMIDGELAEFEYEFEKERRSGAVGDDQSIADRLSELERMYCGTT